MHKNSNSGSPDCFNYLSCLTLACLFDGNISLKLSKGIK